MSLNGLDAPAIAQAYDAAIAAPEGWFLLKYISRDEVDVYKTGTAGTPDVRDAIGQYEDKSPLYGLLLYRKKKVLLKYVPEGTSRLLQARLAVHLSSVTERFLHDTVLSLESAAELTEAKLSSSTSVLKASTSIKSLNSVKSRRLTGITEDVEEISETPKPETTTFDRNLLFPTAITDHDQEIDDTASTSTTKAVRELGETTIDEAVLRPLIEIPESASRPAPAEPESRPSIALSERSLGSKSLHNNFTPSSEAYAYLYKPKVKLAPRPVVESRHSSPYVRPTSTLPEGIQVQGRNDQMVPLMLRTQGLPRTGGSIAPFSSPSTPNVPPIPTLYSPTVDSPVSDYRPVSRGSIVTVPATMRYTDDPALTPEKKRLMKALQKRRQQQKARQLAKEGKFEDDERPQNSLEPASKRSAVSKSKKAVVAPNSSQIEGPGSNGHQADTATLASIEEDSGSPVKESHRPQTMILLSPADGDHSPGFSQTATNDKAGEASINIGKLQPVPSVLQFPNWPDADESLHRPLPPSPPSSDVKRDSMSRSLKRNSTVRTEATPPPSGTVTDHETDQQPVDSSHTTHEVSAATTFPNEDTDAQPKVGNNVQPAMEDTATKHHQVEDLTSDHSSIPVIENAINHDVRRDSPAISQSKPDTSGIFPIGSSVPQENSSSLLPDSTKNVLDGSDQHNLAVGMPIAEGDLKQNLKLFTEPSSIERKFKPPPIATPVRTSHRTSASNSNAPSLSGEDDSLIDELHDATVEEATSISLAKTPTTPFTPSLPRQFGPRQSSLAARHLTPISIMESDDPSSSPRLITGEPAHIVTGSSLEPPVQDTRAESNSGSITPEAPAPLSRPTTRDIAGSGYSTPHSLAPRSRQGSLSPTTGEFDRPSSRKSTVSSLISQRIKAFEDKFSSSSNPQPPPQSAVKAQLVTLRKVSLNTPPQSSGLHPPNGRHNASGFPTPSPSPHSFVHKFAFGKNRKDVSKEPLPDLNKGAADGLPRISISQDKSSDHTETKSKLSFFSPSKLKRKNKNSISSVTSKEGRLSPETVLSASPRSSSDVTARPISRSSAKSFHSESEKKPGFLKRLSQMGSSNHRSIAETMNKPTASTGPTRPKQTETNSQWRSSISLGDLNVQYPDTLLWKRKQVEIDAQGFLTLSPTQLDKNSKAAVKRYHVSEFQMPYVPEPDREELPYSVNLDFLDGNTIQCACESSSAQQRVFHALITARDAFSAV